jgi:small multidrug resistance pump
MPYVMLATAIAFEVAATSFLKVTDGFSRLLPTLAVLAAYAVSFVLLAKVVKEIPVGVAYALWSGLGTMAIVAIAVTFAGEAISAAKVLGVVLIISGAVVLNLSGGH